MLELISEFLTATVTAITPVQWGAAAAVGLALGAIGCLIERRHG